MNKFVTYISMVVFLCVVLSISIGAWYLGRKINYNLGYKDMVNEQIHQTVDKDILSMKERLDKLERRDK